MATKQASSRSAPCAPQGVHAGVNSALADVLERESRGYQKALLAARTGRRRAVHELRIAIRRLAAAIELAQAMQPDRKWNKADRKLREPFKACGRLRDLQVVRDSLRRWRKQDQIPERLLVQADERVDRRRRRLVRCLHDVHPRRNSRRVRALALTLRDPQHDARQQGEVMRSRSAAVARALEGSKQQMQKSCRRARVEDPASLHQARVAVKVHRYQVEMASMLGIPTSRADLPGLRRIQQELGEITDLALLLAEFEKFTSWHPRAGRDLLRARNSLERERRRRFARVHAYDREAASMRGC